MSLWDDLIAGIAPHVEHMRQTVDYHGANITESLEHLKRQSDAGRADTGDKLGFVIRNQKIAGGATRLGGPTLGEIWMIQSICVNGPPNASPAFTIRTNTGRLIFAVVKEGIGNESVGGSILLLQGEELIFETLAEAVFDFTVTYVLRKTPRQIADAGYGVSEQVYEVRARGEHETERDLVNLQESAVGQSTPGYDPFEDVNRPASGPERQIGT